MQSLALQVRCSWTVSMNKVGLGHSTVAGNESTESSVPVAAEHAGLVPTVYWFFSKRKKQTRVLHGTGSTRCGRAALWFECEQCSACVHAYCDRSRSAQNSFERATMLRMMPFLHALGEPAAARSQQQPLIICYSPLALPRDIVSYVSGIMSASAAGPQLSLLPHGPQLCLLPHHSLLLVVVELDLRSLVKEFVVHHTPRLREAANEDDEHDPADER